VPVKVMSCAVDHDWVTGCSL